MIVACDFDNLLNNLTEKTIELYNKQNNKNIKMSDLTEYSFYNCLDKEDSDGITKLFKNKALWDSLTPIPGAKEGLQKLLDMGHRVYIVTATAPENFLWKISWLKKYFPFFNPDNVVRMKDKSLFKCEIMVEDDYQQLINHKLCNRICLTYPWNIRDENVDFVYDIRRCNNWSEILEAVKQIEEEKLEWMKK